MGGEGSTAINAAYCFSTAGHRHIQRHSVWAPPLLLWIIALVRRSHIAYT